MTETRPNAALNTGTRFLRSTMRRNTKRVPKRVPQLGSLWTKRVPRPSLFKRDAVDGRVFGHRLDASVRAVGSVYLVEVS